MSTMRFSICLIALLFISFNACAQDSKTVFDVNNSETTAVEKLPLVPDKSIKNVILLIGDGTGLAQISSGQIHLKGTNNWLRMQSLPVVGMVTTFASNNLITDSAAGATAYSCGMKTNNAMIAVLPDNSPCKTILEYAVEMGKSTGLISTSGITHATPASFASHVESRSMQDVIASQYLDSEVDVLLGGGIEYFIPQSEEGSKRQDDTNLIEEFESKGYSYSSTKTELMNSDSDKLLGLYAQSGLVHAVSEPTLAEMTERALSVLSKNENGFFLMVEGSQIDWAGHRNDAEYLMTEIESFDDAIGASLDFAIQDGETLVVIVADHETGGLSLTATQENNTKMQVSWSTGGHTAIPIPLSAYGPHAIEFSGWHKNTMLV